MERNFRIELPSTLEIIILVSFSPAEILGELKSYFLTYPHWDTVRHTTTGFYSAAFGYAMVDLLNRNKPQHFQALAGVSGAGGVRFSMIGRRAVGVF